MNHCKVRVNGNETECVAGMGLLELFMQLGMNPKLVAIEYNGEILHRQFWVDKLIVDGDILEVVTIVGGG